MKYQEQVIKKQNYLRGLNKLKTVGQVKSCEKTHKFLTKDSQQVSPIISKTPKVFQIKANQTDLSPRPPTKFLSIDKKIDFGHLPSPVFKEKKLTSKIQKQKQIQDFMVKIEAMKKMIIPKGSSLDNQPKQQSSLSVSPSNSHQIIQYDIDNSPVSSNYSQSQSKSPQYESQYDFSDISQFIKSSRKNKIKYSQTTSTSSTRKISIRPKLEDFQILRQIGKGKFGEVYLAKLKSLGFVVALKKIAKKQLDDKLQSQLIHEIKIQLFIDHPNVIKLYGYFDDQKYIYLIMELALSGDLYSLVSKKQNLHLQENSVKIIVKQICQGLSELHSNEIIHRDLKLENILYQMNMIKICDFGWSVEGQLLRQTFCGTPLYFSPEILKQKGYDIKVDIWSLGILTFELLNGTVPFEIRQEADFCKIIFDEVTFPKTKNNSPSSTSFIKACLKKEAKQRPSAAQLLKHQFLNFENLESHQLA